MPVWCRMFQQTLDGKAREWFDKLPPGSIDNWGDLQEKFLIRFGMLKACDKDPTEISKIVQKANETLPNFKERWVSESNTIPNVSELMQISSFMSSHKCPELAKHFSDSIPKTVDEILKRVDDYLRSEEAFRNTELPNGEFQQKYPPVQWIHHNDQNQHFLYGNHRRRSEHKPTFRAYERHTPYVPPQHSNQEFRRPRESRAVLTLDSLSSTPQEILETEHQLRLPQPAPLVGVPSKENLNRYCDYHNEKGHSTNDCFHLKQQLEKALESGKLNHLVKDVRQRGRTWQRNNGPQKSKVIDIVQLSGFSGEQVKPLGKIELDVCFGGVGLCQRAIMKFTIIPAPSPNNIILGCPGLKQLRAIPSTIHGMMKVPTLWVIATLMSQAPIIFECRREGKKQAVERPKETEPQEKPADMTGVPKRIINRSLNSNPSITSVSQKGEYFARKKVRRWTESGGCVSTSRKLIPRIRRTIIHCQKSTARLSQLWGFHSNAFSMLTRATTKYRWQRNTRRKPPSTRIKSQIGRNLEVYVDDMVVKSKSKREMLADIAETFDNLRRINMKLYQKKCSFGVLEGKFLGYMVTSEGIRDNPAKTKDIAEMQSPRTWGEMQILVGKLAALNRFLSQLAEKSLHFFETLKDITKENKHDYCWTEMAENAFQELKKMVLDLPARTTPLPKETLFVYLAASKEAVSVVLLVVRHRRQHPVHYVSRTLYEAELNYAPLEKMALALRHISRGLRRYFEAHPITVITDQPIKQILNKADTSGRLAPDFVELAAYNITYEPRSAIKGHILLDFINEVSVGSKTIVPRQNQYTIDHQKDCKEEWVLYIDGASSAKGSGVGLVLISPTKMEYTYALRLNFESTNNQAEYESLLVGLRIAKKMGVQSLSVNVDSKLVVSQINGNYKACKENMIRYLSKAKEYIGCFKIFKIQNIPRNKNQKADVLSKLSLVAFNHLTKEILMETLDVSSMDMEEINGVVEEEGETWMTPIVNCLEKGVWPEDQNEARALRMKIGKYVMEEGHASESKIGGGKGHLARYYWPMMYRDAREEIRKCDSCQIHSSIPKLPKTLMTSIMAPWPFFQWGMDVLGPLPEALRKYGLPKIIVMDNGTNFIHDPFKSWCSKLNITQINTAVPHPQANGLVERANRSLMEGIKTQLGREKKGWVDELPNVLWPHRTSLKTRNGKIPYGLTFGSEAVIPTEIGMPTHRTMMIKEGDDNEEEMRLNLDLLTERREAAAIREARYKMKMEQYYNKRVRPMSFKVGEYVYWKNEASRVENLGKLGPK
ncbi:reverse transcriptase domain-containing protein [Tanacetum coccineum]|uniref:Reverse transcriptase domain-containing protein n=1 Tax=Tanacetum coccineum TaxID=301880 RepID=A0ABQ5CYB9_9ASTR